MNVENKKVFITGLNEWQNKLAVRENDLKFESESDKIDMARRLYLKERIDKINELRLNIRIEIKKQEQESKHYVGV